MADVPMTRAEAVRLIEAHEHVVRRWAGAHHDKIEEAMHEQIASREPIIAALTRPAPQPSEGELRDQIVQAIYEQNPIRKYEFGDGVTLGRIVPWTTVPADDQFRYLRQANAVMSLLPRLGQQPSADDDALVDELIDAVRGDCADWVNGAAPRKQGPKFPQPAPPCSRASPRAASRVPEGWQLVPETPTKEMMKAASDIATKSAAENYGGAPSGDDYWYAMLAAAPAPEVKP